MNIDERMDYFKIGLEKMIKKMRDDTSRTQHSHCEVCGKPATMHEGRHNFCKRHWQERVIQG